MRSKKPSKQPMQLQLLELPRCDFTLEEIWSRLAELVKQMSPEEKAQVRAQIDQEFLHKK